MGEEKVVLLGLSGGYLCSFSLSRARHGNRDLPGRRISIARKEMGSQVPPMPDAVTFAAAKPGHLRECSSSRTARVGAARVCRRCRSLAPYRHERVGGLQPIGYRSHLSTVAASSSLGGVRLYATSVRCDSQSFTESTREYLPNVH